MPARRKKVTDKTRLNECFILVYLSKNWLSRVVPSAKLVEKGTLCPAIFPKQGFSKGLFLVNLLFIKLLSHFQHL
jgi:hypothetical protein